MSQIIRTDVSLVERLPALIPLPAPRVELTVRLADRSDIPFIDALQKANRKAVGFLRTTWIEERIAKGEVLIAEDAERLGYVIGTDRYFRRDDCGIIYQMNVVPGHRRKLVGATLLKHLFERSAYGCRLFCCWCAQDIDANRFWEAMGFVPLAFRAGSEKASRVHIFWQRRIRAGDGSTPYWYPTQTNGGSIREGRVVLPIPPGMRWSDDMPRVFPGEASPDAAVSALESEPRRALPGPREKKAKEDLKTPSGLYFAVPKPTPAPRAKPARKPRGKNDPRLIAKARELRDRWLEQVNGRGLELAAGKYDVARLAA